MKFSSTDKISETVSLIRNKKIYFIGRNKCKIKKIRVLAFFQTRPVFFWLLWAVPVSYSRWSLLSAMAIGAPETRSLGLGTDKSFSKRHACHAENQPSATHARQKTNQAPRMPGRKSTKRHACQAQNQPSATHAWQKNQPWRLNRMN